MASFTMMLRDAIYLGGGEDDSYKSIGLNDYPIFDEEYRPILNGKIIRAYWNEEIGFEDLSLFRMAMRSRLELSMPYFNGLYETERLEFDPLSTIDLTTISDTSQTTDTSANGSSTSTSTGSSTSESRNFSYPQQQLRSNGEYMTSAAQADSDSDSETSSDEQSTSTVEAAGQGSSTVTGRQGAATDLIKAFRDNLLSIDQMVIDEISDLFMGVWSTGQAFTNSQTGYFSPYSGF